MTSHAAGHSCSMRPVGRRVDRTDVVNATGMVVMMVSVLKNSSRTKEIKKKMMMMVLMIMIISWLV